MNEDTLQFIREHRNDDVRQLMLGASCWPEADVREACVQIAAWQRARQKLPTWAACDGILYPAQLPMEQCSSELTARYKAEVACLLPIPQGGSITDLTGGFGVDATMLAVATGGTLTFVERNEDLCRLARHNLPLMGVGHAEVVCGDALEVLDSLPRQDLIFVDPARRDEHGGRTVAIADCTPDIEQLQEQLTGKAGFAMVKLSPMLDMADALRRLHNVCEVHIVSVDGECKEILMVLSKEHKTRATQDEIPVVCVNLSDRHPLQTFTFTYGEEHEAACQYTKEPGSYLYEPNASLLKAHAFKSVAQRFGLRKLHRDSHLYTADMPCDNFPGRQFEVIGVTDFNKKNIKALLTGISRANLTIRNFPLSVADLRRRLKLSEGGDDYLFATTLATGQHVLVLCRK